MKNIINIITNTLTYGIITANDILDIVVELLT